MKTPYVIRGEIGAYEVVDTRTDRVAHTFKHHPDAESCKDSMNEWVRQEAAKNLTAKFEGMDTEGLAHYSSVIL